MKEYLNLYQVCHVDKFGFNVFYRKAYTLYDAYAYAKSYLGHENFNIMRVVGE